MAFVKFAKKDEPRVTMLFLFNQVPFTSYRGDVWEVPDAVLDRLIESGIAFERVEGPPALTERDKTSRVFVRLVSNRCFLRQKTRPE